MAAIGRRSDFVITIRGGHQYECNAETEHGARAEAVRRHWGDDAPTCAEYFDVSGVLPFTEERND